MMCKLFVIILFLFSDYLASILSALFRVKVFGAWRWTKMKLWLWVCYELSCSLFCCC